MKKLTLTPHFTVTKVNPTKLTLHLKKRWYDMIKSGEKPEEYRAMTDYWLKRLYEEVEEGCYEPKHFDLLELCCGYPAANDKTRRMLFANPYFIWGCGHKKWGAPGDGRTVIIIRWESKFMDWEDLEKKYGKEPNLKEIIL